MKYLIPLILILINSCEDNIADQKKVVLFFVASEGNFGNSNGSIEVFKGEEKIQTVGDIGDVVQSILVFEDNLFVAINNSHMIKKYKITDSGLSEPGIEVSTDNSGPREMCIVNNKIYFTNWLTKDIKVLDLFNYTIKTFTSLPNVPEDIVTDGVFLWVSTPHQELYDSQGSLVIKIDISNGSIVETYEVGLGPEQLYLDGDLLYVSRTTYDSDFSANYGSSKINIITGDVDIVNYGTGTACRADIFKINNSIYRATNIGVVSLDENLNLNQMAKIGNYNNIYSANFLNDQLILGSSDYSAPDTVYLHNSSNELVGMLKVNVLPGDFQVYQN